MLNNRTLSESVEVKGSTHIAKVVRSMDKNTDMHGTLDNEAWSQSVASFAFGGIPDTEEEQFAKLDALDIEWRNEMAIPSARPGGKRSGGTGFKLHPTFKSYKSLIKGSIEQGVELLDAAGEVRAKGGVQEEIKEAKKVERTPEEKFAMVIDTALKILPECDTGNQVFIDAMNKLTNILKASNLY